MGAAGNELPPPSSMPPELVRRSPRKKLAIAVGVIALIALTVVGARLALRPKPTPQSRCDDQVFAMLDDTTEPVIAVVVISRDAPGIEHLPDHLEHVLAHWARGSDHQLQVRHLGADTPRTRAMAKQLGLESRHFPGALRRKLPESAFGYFGLVVRYRRALGVIPIVADTRNLEFEVARKIDEVRAKADHTPPAVLKACKALGKRKPYGDTIR